jgi:hypothetical protein
MKRRLEFAVLVDYIDLMETIKGSAPAGWLESLAVSEAELGAGLTVPMETVLEDLDDSIRLIESMRNIWVKGSALGGVDTPTA